MNYSPIQAKTINGTTCDIIDKQGINQSKILFPCLLGTFCVYVLEIYFKGRGD